MGRSMAVVAMAGFVALGAFAQGAAAAPLICLRMAEVDHTSVPNNRTVLFFMKDGTVWQNTLQAPCVGLTTSGYKVNVDPTGVICSNQKTIKSLFSGNVCPLGAFVRVPPKAAPAKP